VSAATSAVYALSSFNLAQAKEGKAGLSAQPPLPDDVVINAIRARWLELGGPHGVLGRPVTPELSTPDGIGRYNHFTGGSIYWTPTTGAWEIYGAIRERWSQLGWERSWLGYPIRGELDFPEGGRVNSFERGQIYWWPDTGPIDLNDVVIHYTGLICFGETDWDQGSDLDEPYVIMGMLDPANNTWEIRSRIYNTDGGDSRPDLLELYRGKPGGLTISALIMEHDEGDPDKYKEVVRAGVIAASDGIAALTTLIPAIGPVIAVGVGALLSAVEPDVTNIINNMLDLGDDKMGEATIALSAKDMVLLATRTENSWERGVGFKLSTPLLGDGGASYKAYFGIVTA
jgi:hypothetical protein